MSSIGTLYTTTQQSAGKRILAVAAFGGLKLDLPKDYVHYTTNKTPEFLAKFPHGKIPALETNDGFRLTESTAIARYVASLAPNSTLLGSDNKEAALIDQWVNFANTEIATHVRTLIGFQLGGAPYFKPLHTSAVENATTNVKKLDNDLKDRTFLVGERITLADITVATVIQQGLSILFDPATRAQIPNVIRHFETIANQPQLKEIFGETTYAEKAWAYTPPAKEKKEPKPAAAPAPKAEKKPKKAEEDEEDDDLVPKEEPKAKNPLDSLPKSSFNLEDWKRAYSNKETRGPDGAIEWFYQNYDPEGFSVWRADFKYNEELTQTFMSSNQITGFFNRLEGSRKYLFATMGVLGEANNSVISGVFLVRGPEAVPVVSAAPDYESYDFKRLDLKNEDDKKFFEAALAWDLELDGKKWVDGTGKELK